MFEAVLTFVIRLMGAVVWTAIFWYRVRGSTSPLPYAHRVVMSLVVVGLWVLAFGGLARFNFIPSDVFSLIYTTFSFVALVTGLAIWSIRKE